MIKSRILFFIFTGLSALLNAQSTDSLFNMGFETGSLKNWQTFVGNCCPIRTGEIKNYKMTPALASDFYITSKGDTDFYCGFETVSPCGGEHSLRVGDLKAGSKASKVKYNITIPKDSNNYTLDYYYALVFTDLPHPYEAQQRYLVKVYDSSTHTLIDSSITFPFLYSPKLKKRYFYNGNNIQMYYYRTWTKVSVPVNGYAGETIAIEFEVGDCSEGGHLAYLYIDFRCSGLICKCTPKELTYKRCKTDVTIKAPKGYETYEWLDSAMKSTKTSTTDSLNLNHTGRSKYAVILTKCCRKDTLYIIIEPYINSNYFNVSDTGLCMKGNLFYIARKSTSKNISYQWDFGDSTHSTAANISKHYNYIGKFNVKSTSIDTNNCRDTFTMDLYVYPQAKIDFEGDSVCIGNVINLNAKSNLPNTINFKWTLDNLTIAGKNIFHQFSSSGLYDVTLTATTDKGCPDTVFKTGVVEIRPLPSINYSYLKVSDQYTTFRFDFHALPDRLKSTYLWKIENTDYTDANPTVEFFDTGIKKITLMVRDSFGCQNNISGYLNVQYDTVSIFLPNAFSPDKNGLNDLFMPVFHYIKFCDFSIYNRWGEELFQTSDLNQGWNGTYKGKDVPQDVYFWIIKATGYNQVKYGYEGTVTLIRGN